MVELYEECRRIEDEADDEFKGLQRVAQDLGAINGLDIDLLEDEPIPNLLVETSERIPPEPLEQIALDSSTEQYEQQLDSYAELKTHYQALLTEEAKLSKKYRKETRKAQKYAAKEVKAERKRLQKLQKQLNQTRLAEGKEGIETKLAALSQAEKRHILNYLIGEHPTYQLAFRDCKDSDSLPSAVNKVYQTIILDELQLNPQEEKIFKQYKSEKRDLHTIIKQKLEKYSGLEYWQKKVREETIATGCFLSFMGLFASAAAIAGDISPWWSLSVPVPVSLGYAIPTAICYVNDRLTHPQRKDRKQAKKDLKRLKETTIENLIETRITSKP
ncbi:hypothetical protein GOV03_04370 [Candidatus Woesearchaeota archaeon]|nr:hypothetical protein [Candidatus Woesearchaeota archaeon]